MANLSTRAGARAPRRGAARAVAALARAADLYIARHEGVDIGIGTESEIRDLVAEGTLPANIDLVAAT